jgi:hypothetical protein
VFVAYTERGDRLRIISARRATQREQDEYFKQMLRPMSLEAIEKAASANPDARPLTEADSSE